MKSCTGQLPKTISSVYLHAMICPFSSPANNNNLLLIRHKLVCEYDQMHLYNNELYNSKFFTNQIKSNVGFWREGKTRVPREKPLRAEYRTNKLRPPMTPSPGIEPGTHWWKASTLTTVPTLLGKLKRDSCMYAQVFQITEGSDIKAGFLILWSGNLQDACTCMKQ